MLLGLSVAKPVDHYIIEEGCTFVATSNTMTGKLLYKHIDHDDDDGDAQMLLCIPCSGGDTKIVKIVVSGLSRIACIPYV